MDFMSNFWNVFWIFLWSFFFIVYLMVLFSIIADLFRDSSLNGWLKAVWIIFLIFVPFLTALIYLIARGQGMAMRGAKQARQARQESDAYIKQVAGSRSAADEIAAAKSLLDAGSISQAEYDQLKAKALS